MRKAQIFSVDFIIALLLAFSIISIFAFTWLNMPSHSQHLQQKAFSIAEYLASGKIADESVIDCNKLAEIAFEEYENLKAELNAYPYDIWIEFPDIDASLCPSIRRKIDVMIVLDRSGSMWGDKLTDAKNAAKTFVDMLNETYDQAGLVSFSSTASLDKELLTMDDANKTELKDTIDALTAGGATNIGDGIAAATTELTSERARSNAAKIQILLSDGKANRPWGVNATQYAIDKAKEACRKNINIYTISLGSGADRELMQAIANITSGQEYYAPTSDQLQEIFEQIANKIAVSQNYGAIAPKSVKNIGSVVRIVLLNGKALRMVVRVYEGNGVSRCD